MADDQYPVEIVEALMSRTAALLTAVLAVLLIGGVAVAVPLSGGTDAAAALSLTGSSGSHCETVGSEKKCEHWGDSDDGSSSSKLDDRETKKLLKDIFGQVNDALEDATDQVGDDRDVDSIDIDKIIDDAMRKAGSDD
ncbi:hypothetical protein [Pseudonocardia spinosispora]|uniref:hypothetical protein n=1 Tax=Pseudonocardia spinosispora TaxID=103441 RepID=UPI00048CC8AB|nr:hypothetical protein [Pseudonocardia spinosispora]